MSKIGILLAGMCVTLVVLSAGPGTAEVYVYPSKGQDEKQQQKDEWECHQWATQQTGVNPSQPAQQHAPRGSEQMASPVRGAAGGAALGAIGGAIGGDAGKGAAIGAGVGGVLNVFRRRRQVEADYAAQNRVHQQHAAALNQYDQAYATCLKGRGYTVS